MSMRSCTMLYCSYFLLTYILTYNWDSGEVNMHLETLTVLALTLQELHRPTSRMIIICWSVLSAPC